MNAQPVLTLILFAFTALSHAGAHTWIEDSFEDFADGTLDAGGQNQYAARNGTVRAIHRFDLNDDGWIDLLFNSTHDLIGILPSTLGYFDRSGVLHDEPLAVEGALRAAAADLNRDGWLDVVFCPNRQGIQHPRRFVTIIYGGPDGWPAARSNGLLPVHNASDLAVVDLNADAWPDLAVLNGPAWLPGQPDGHILRVFWGGERGFLLTRYRDYGIENGLALVAADFNGDSAADLAALSSTGVVQVFLSSDDEAGPEPDRVETVPLPGADGVSIAAGDIDNDGRMDLVVGCRSEALYTLTAEGSGQWDPQTLVAFPATHVAIGDLDGDQRADCVLTESSIAHAAGGEAIGARAARGREIRVLWGGEGGFTRDRSAEFSVPFATAAAVGEVNGDGRPDLTVAVYQSVSGTFAASSTVLLGKGDRRLSAVEGPKVSGATDVAIVPSELEFPARMIFANSQGGHVDERIALDLYWGGPEGFSIERRLSIPFASGYEATAADFNADGHVDLLALCSGHAGGAAAEAMTQLGGNIYWGKAGGIAFEAPPTPLREYNLYSSNTADLDKDGHLDIVLGAFAPPPDNDTEVLVIYYCGAEGYSRERRAVLPSPGRSSICSIADLNRDQWLDIAVTSYEADRVRIFWGGSKGFSAEQQRVLEIPKPIELETADLNADGWLDLIVGSYEDPVTKHQDTGLLIFWGGTKGFAEWNAQWLPGYTPVGITVADWDADGRLDLLSTHYHGELSREQLPSYLYWGGPAGFDTRNRSVFICDSPSDALAADFDRDGLLDIAVSNHSKDGDHATMSQVYYNDGGRFQSPRVTRLPTVGPHWMWTEDMGHIYSRAWSQVYESSVSAWQGPYASGMLDARVDVPAGTRVEFEVRSASDVTALQTAEWRAVAASSFSLESTDRVMQYRVRFLSDNGDRYPVLDRVAITLKP